MRNRQMSAFTAKSTMKEPEARVLVMHQHLNGEREQGPEGERDQSWPMNEAK
ncbi:MAG: hypothetical protein IPJ85_10315 [Flavobacteriales bacterium]|nr:hypothetical protein [Flavobacteriales bacterium]